MKLHLPGRTYPHVYAASHGKAGSAPCRNGRSSAGPLGRIRAFLSRHSLLAAYLAFGVTVSGCMAAFAALAVHGPSAFTVLP